MLSISKMKPESSNAGRNAAISAAWLAANWFFVTVEINRPSGSMAARNAEETATQRPRRAAERHAERR